MVNDQLLPSVESLDEFYGALVAAWGQPCLPLFKEAAAAARGGSAQLLPRLLQLSDILVDLCWEKLHTGPWQEVHVGWRDAYSLASLLLCLARLQQLQPAPMVLDISGPADATAPALAAWREPAGATAATIAASAAAANGARDHPAPSADAQRGVSGAGDAADGLPGEPLHASTVTLQEVMRQLDLAVIMGGPRFQPLIHRAVEEAAVLLRRRQQQQQREGQAPAAPAEQLLRLDADSDAYGNYDLAVTAPRQPATSDCALPSERPQGILPSAAESDLQQPAEAPSRAVGPPRKRLKLPVPTAAASASLAAAAEPRATTGEGGWGLAAPATRRSGGGELPTQVVTEVATDAAHAEVVPAIASAEQQLPSVGVGGVTAATAARPVPLPPGSLLQSSGCARPRVLHVPSLDTFAALCMLADGGAGSPAIITAAMEHWPARQRWADIGYLRRVAGFRTVPVEVGRNYLAEQWGQQMMTLDHFIGAYILGHSRSCSSGSSGGGGDGQTSGGLGYLAQHPLFDQIPALRRDICVPDYCSLGEGELRSINAWLGPAGTVTPLHHDPHHNLLAQVVGKKYVRLYHPRHTPSLYPFTEGLTTNSSQVDLDAPDAAAHPRFSAAPYVDCVLEAGQMLYIPPGWWHYVKSLTVSFSVSFWWA